MNLLDKRFDYSYAVSHRYEIPNQFIQIKNKKIKLELLVTNGFVKIYTYKGRIYSNKILTTIQFRIGKSISTLYLRIFQNHLI